MNSHLDRTSYRIRHRKLYSRALGIRIFFVLIHIREFYWRNFRGLVRFQNRGVVSKRKKSKILYSLPDF